MSKFYLRKISRVEWHPNRAIVLDALKGDAKLLENKAALRSLQLIGIKNMRTDDFWWQNHTKSLRAKMHNVTWTIVKGPPPLNFNFFKKKLGGGVLFAIVNAKILASPKASGTDLEKTEKSSLFS